MIASLINLSIGGVSMSFFLFFTGNYGIIYNFMRLRNNILIHKQVEERDGLRFLRIKKIKLSV